MDCAMAIDEVWRQSLFNKMVKQGLSAKIVKSIYANIKSKVMVNRVLALQDEV